WSLRVVGELVVGERAVGWVRDGPDRADPPRLYSDALAPCVHSGGESGGSGSVRGRVRVSEMTAPERELAVEQQHVDRVYERLAELRREARELREAGYAKGQERHPGALFDRDVMVFQASRMLRELETEHEGLVFGRLDTVGGTGAQYVGRLGVRDPDFEPLVIDWRAPAAAPFYRATPEQPMDVVRRRTIRSF